MIIGVIGIIFSVVFAATMFTFDVLRPVGLVGSAIVRPIAQASMWLFAVCSVISIISGVKVLVFILAWHKRYTNLKVAEKELEKKYFRTSKHP